MSERLTYKNLVFDDFVKDGPGRYWSQICKTCASGLTRRKNPDPCCDESTCGVYGCTNEADWYIDFDPLYLAIISE